MTVSRNTFDPLKNYQEVQFNEDVSLLDSELNEAQQIQNHLAQETRRVAFGASVVGDEWAVVSNGSVNSITVKAGTFLHNGFALELHTDFVIAFLTTPVADRTDVVFVEYFEQVIDSVQDPNILDPQVGSETTQRIKLSYNIRVAENSSVPTPTPGYSYFRIATLNRLAGNSLITDSMIADDRWSTMHTYVVSGCRPTIASGLQVQVLEGQVRVASVDYYVSSIAPAVVVPANQTSYVIMRGASLEVLSSLPYEFYVPIAQVVSNATDITSLQDIRLAQPLIYKSGNGSEVSVPTPDPPIDTPERSSGTFSSFAAGQDVSAYQLVYASASQSNTVLLADNTTDATVPCIAIALNDVASGNVGTFMKSGQIQSLSWNWTLGKPIFLGTGGGMTQTPPTADYTIVQVIAQPVTSTTIEFLPSLKWRRN